MANNSRSERNGPEQNGMEGAGMEWNGSDRRPEHVIKLLAPLAECTPTQYRCPAPEFPAERSGSDRRGLERKGMDRKGSERRPEYVGKLLASAGVSPNAPVSTGCIRGSTARTRG